MSPRGLIFYRKVRLNKIKFTYRNVGKLIEPRWRTLTVKGNATFSFNIIKAKKKVIGFYEFLPIPVTAWSEARISLTARTLEPWV
jgi:hypothetical protein